LAESPLLSMISDRGINSPCGEATAVGCNVNCALAGAAVAKTSASTDGTRQARFRLMVKVSRLHINDGGQTVRSTQFTQID